MLEFAVHEVLGVKIGVCVHSYFGMADNGDVIHPQEFLILGAEHPVPVPFAVPVVGGITTTVPCGDVGALPIATAIRRGCSQCGQRLRWRRPIDDNLSSRVSAGSAFQSGLPASKPYHSKDGFRQGRFQGLQCLLGRLDDEFSFELPECPAQHIKAVVNMGDDRLFLGQLQTLVCRKSRMTSLALLRSLLSPP